MTTKLHLQPLWKLEKMTKDEEEYKLRRPETVKFTEQIKY